MFFILHETNPETLCMTHVFADLHISRGELFTSILVCDPSCCLLLFSWFARGSLLTLDYKIEAILYYFSHTSREEHS